MTHPPPAHSDIVPRNQSDESQPLMRSWWHVWFQPVRDQRSETQRRDGARPEVKG